MSTFHKDKIPIPNCWTLEFYLVFFEFLGEDLLCVVEKVRVSRKVLGSINSKFIVFIPKVDRLDNFDAFIPVPLCNCVYNIFSKHWQSD